jgi:hypothetical protein
MDLGIAGKVVFFTGGSKGMGRIAAQMLAEEGCKVAIVARSEGPVDEVVSKIVAGGGTAVGVTADITIQHRQPDCQIRRRPYISRLIYGRSELASEAPGGVYAIGDGFAFRVNKYRLKQCDYQESLIVFIQVVPGFLGQFL